MIITIGYPIGFSTTESGNLYTIETQEKYVHLSYEELQIWAKIDSAFYPNKSELIVIHRLEKAGLLIQSDDVKTVLGKLLSHKYVRQGYAMVNNDGNCIYQGNTITNVSESCNYIWQLGNGKTSIESILTQFVKKGIYSLTSLPKIIDDILFLVDHELIYII